MKNKILKLAMLFSLTAAILTACNSNNSNKESADSAVNSDEMSQGGMGTVQTDSLKTDTAHQHVGMQGDTVN
jgi:ABC-type enterochelin transport system substrate-binding protein